MKESKCYCRGRLGWEDPDTGQFVTCLNCLEGRTKHAEDVENQRVAQEISDRKLRQLQKKLTEGSNVSGTSL